MKTTIKVFVSECVVCQQAKTERVPYPGLLQPLHVPYQAWIVVTKDFIEGLPISTGYNYILVVVDKFSKYSHFVKLKHPFCTHCGSTVHGTYLQATWYAYDHSLGQG